MADPKCVQKKKKNQGYSLEYRWNWTMPIFNWFESSRPTAAYYIKYSIYTQVLNCVGLCGMPFHTVHGVLKARILKWFAIPFSRRPCCVRILHHDLSVFGGPTQSSSFTVSTELDKVMVHVIRLVSFLSVCPQMEKDKRIMGENDWGGNRVLFWWAGLWSVNL